MPLPSSLIFPKMPPPAGTQLRWLVRLEQIEPPRFSDNVRETLFWAVRPYIALPGGRRRIGNLTGYYPNRALPAAHDHATKEATTYYGGRR